MTLKKEILLTIILILFLFNLDIVIESVINSSYLFFNKVFVCIFPFIILSNILIYYNYHIFLSKTIGKFISKIFNIDENSTIVFILSILTSAPSNSIYINDLLDKGIINESEANKVLIFTYFPSIAFIIGSIGISIYNSFKIGLILLISNYLCNIAIGIFLRKNNYKHNIIKENTNKEDFFVMLKGSILKGFNTSFIILGNIIIFTIISNLITSYINLNPIINSILSGILEMTGGINSISNLNISISIKIVLTSFLLNFSGLSIIFQSKSILSNYKINIKKILIIKLVFSIIFSLLLYYVPLE